METDDLLQELVEKDDEIERLKNQVDDLEEQIDDLNGTIASLKYSMREAISTLEHEL